MRDPVPEEASVNCNYEAKHAEPKYRESRGWRLGALTSLGFACIVFDQAALNPIAPLPIRNVRGIGELFFHFVFYSPTTTRAADAITGYMLDVQNREYLLL